jgi:cytoskeletal protein CcmA (bactofilin family)
VFSRTGAKPGSDTFETILGKGVEIKGAVKSKGSIRIDGAAEGSISSEGGIVVGQAAVLTADLMAQNVTIAGQVSGNIKCLHRLELLPTARLKGDIVAGSLVISEGAVFSGSSQMAEPPEEKHPVKSEIRELRLARKS